MTVVKHEDMPESELVSFEEAEEAGLLHAFSDDEERTLEGANPEAVRNTFRLMIREQDRWNQGFFAREGKFDPKELATNPKATLCGTSFCMAGWAPFTVGGGFVKNPNYNPYISSDGWREKLVFPDRKADSRPGIFVDGAGNEIEGSVSQWAQEEFGITEDEAYALFISSAAVDDLDVMAVWVEYITGVRVRDLLEESSVEVDNEVKIEVSA